ncbi:hypothetical protein CRV00_02995 [Malaciobacter molluscorum]|uniref:XdhC family protein n=1 Tax=Malaciobacter molluscorum TaxID=1032072 RepID=UPI00100AC1EC|nr:XdhC family protein [Malaciobacter molluscorum]RXJ96165.1 hypothetical protein CRV00_02995 [Malaciobacter molluscorum]
MFSDKNIFNFIQKSIEKNFDIVVTSVISTHGSTYSKAGNLCVYNSNNETIGILGSAFLHRKINELSLKTLKTKQLDIFESIPKDKLSGHGTSRYLICPFFYEDNYGALKKCFDNFNKSLVRNINDYNDYKFIDDNTDIKLENTQFYQKIKRPFSLLIFGAANHVLSLIDMANLLGWNTTIIDVNIDEKFICNADNTINLKNIDEVFNIDMKSYDASVILSHNPKTDYVYLEALLNSNINYIGMMGNKKNMLNIKKRFNLEDSDRFFAPVGLDIGSNTDQSIALSICSQIESKKNGKI